MATRRGGAKCGSSCPPRCSKAGSLFRRETTDAALRPFQQIGSLSTTPRSCCCSTPPIGSPTAAPNRLESSFDVHVDAPALLRIEPTRYVEAEQAIHD